ncbi:PspC domain-containing protein [Nonomuraea sp. NPDC048882]|uniref:PspC domain-containing protein n=1 Tax=Nonomuraea sp. NPDC048882 TaxID=3154347 RepID=UPI0034100778
MTEAPPRQPAAPPRELRRSSEGRFLMGVCAGLGRYTGIDPVVFRVGVAVLLLGSGVGLLLYLAAFLLMKEPNGRPGLIEQWTRRDFDAEAVMALLSAVLAFGLALNLATVWLDTGTLVVGVFLAVSLLAAHSSGVDLLGLARSMPERLLRRQGERPAAHFSPAPPTTPVPRAPRPAPEGVDEAVPPANADESVTSANESVTSAGAGRQPVTGSVRPPATPAAPAESAMPAESAAPQESAAPAESGAPGREAREAASVEELRAAADSARDAAYRARQAAARRERGVSPEAVTAEHAVPGPLRPEAAPSDPRPAYRPDPPAALDYSGYGEPFAPNGPYQPLDPAKRAGGHSPYDPALYGRPIPPKRDKRAPRPRSYIGAITILLAIIIGGIVVAVQARSAGGVSPTVVGGAMLITVGAGLLIAAWWGRGAGLVAAGTALVLIVAMGLVLGGLPRNIGPSEWTPTTIAEANQLYDVGLGDGRLDLSELRLPPGTHVTFNAAVSAGELVVIVPPTARVEVHATNKIGDIVIDQSLKGGVQVRSDKVLEPETKPEGKVSTIVLYLKGGVGDMEVRRAA